MTTIRQIELTNVGPIEYLAIPIPKDGGVVVLRGRNGSGKSTALDATGSLMDPDAESSLSIRDGQERGSVVGLGVELTLKKRGSRAGTLTVEKIRGEDPALLVNPGLKDPAAANKVRIRVLCRLARVNQTRETFAPLEEEAGMSLPITLGENLPESAAKTKRAIEGKALDLERVVAKDEGTVQQLIRSAASIDLDAPHDQALLASAHTKAIRELSAVEGEASACLRASQDAERARHALETAKEAYKGPTKDEAAVTMRAALVEEARLAGLHRDAQEASRLSADKFEAAADFERAIAGWEATVAKAENAFGVTEDQLSAMRRAVREAEEANEKGVLVRRALQEKKDAEDANAALAQKRAQALKLREAAAGCDRIVSNAISTVAPRGLKIIDGRLVVAHKRGEIPFEDLSHGERWAIALDVGIDAVGKDGLLSIAQEAWEGLDDANRQAINDHAKSRAAVILTAEATMDELKAEVVS